MRLDKFTIKAQEAIQDAQAIADEYSHQQIDVEHLLMALVRQPEGIVVPMLQKIGVNVDQLMNSVENKLESIPQVHGSGVGQAYISDRLSKVLDKSLNEAKSMKDEYVSTEHILLAISEDKDVSVLREQGASKETILSALMNIRGQQRVTDQNPEDKYQALERFTRDLTDLARSGKLDPVIGRNDEIRRVMQVLSRRTKNNPVLIGDTGVGKTAIAEGLAQRIVDGDIPETLKDKRVVSLDMVH